MEVLELSAVALAPVIFIMTYIYLRDEYEREPLKYLIVTFVLGVLAAIPVIYIGRFLQTTFNIDKDGGFEQLIIYSFFVVAFTEEWMKYLVLRWYNYPHKEFDEPYDGIMYGSAVALGFAAIENLLYVFTSEGNGLEIGLFRMFTAVPAHATFGVIMGYFVGKAKFLPKRHPFWERMKGLFAAILFHGLYDYFLFLGNTYLAIFSFTALGIGILLAQRAMKLHASISPHREDDSPFA
ncbi:MAG: PrsW family glutamic-type intramembrane protease [Bacteroidia bacterium]|nr:PrsW family glutamic-type intramembrane protease [Bacteroidia bacterium]